MVAALVIYGATDTTRGMMDPRQRVLRLSRPSRGGRFVMANGWRGCDVEKEAVFCRVDWVDSGEWYGAVIGVCTLVEFRDGEDSVVSALKSTDSIVVLRRIEERWRLLVCCIGGVVCFGGVQVPVLIMELSGLRGVVLVWCREQIF